MIKQKELTDFSKSQLALYFYNNSNYVAILFPQRAFKRRKAFIYGLFHGCEITPTLQQRCTYKLFCLEILSSFVLDYLMYPYYPSLPIYCYHFVINLDNSQIFHNLLVSLL